MQIYPFQLKSIHFSKFDFTLLNYNSFTKLVQKYFVVNNQYVIFVKQITINLF